MSGTSDGQLANENTFNGAYLARNGDSDTIGKIDLLNNGIDPLSGTDIVNLQKNVNALASALGIPVNQVATYLISWASTVVGLSSSSSKDKIEALVLKFRDTLVNGGHTHTGANGEGPQLSITDILGINQFKAAWQGVTINSVSGTSFDVSSTFASSTPGGDTNVAGVITTVPYNFCYVVDPITGTFIEDGEGQRVYGRLTESAGTWTLSFYTNEAGTQTTYNLPSQNIKLLYLEVFTLANIPTIESNPGEFGTLDVTADVVDASATLRGVVNILAQSFAGNKTFNNNVGVLGKLIGDDVTDSSTTGSAAAMPAPAKTVVKLTNASLASIATITGSTDKQFFLIINKTGNQISLNHNDASNGILTFTGLAMDLPDNAAALIWHDNSASRYVVIGGGGGGGGDAFQETPTGTVDGTNDTFTLSETPVSSDALAVFVDGVLATQSEYSLVGDDIVFVSGSIPAPGQSVYAFYSAAPGGGGGGGSLSPVVQYITLNSTDITNKYVTLSGTPSGPTTVMLDIIGGGAQEYSVDFTVSGTQLSWNGLALDGLLASGDKLRIHYFT